MSNGGPAQRRREIRIERQHGRSRRGARLPLLLHHKIGVPRLGFRRRLELVSAGRKSSRRKIHDRDFARIGTASPQGLQITLPDRPVDLAGMSYSQYGEIALWIEVQLSGLELERGLAAC